MRKSISILGVGALLLGGAGLCLGTASGLSPSSTNVNEAQSAPLQIREDNSPLVRDAKDGTTVQ